MNDSKQRKIGVILSYISIIASTLIQLLYTPFLVKMLGQSEYGLYSLVYSIIGYLTVLDLGFGNAIIVYTSKYRATKNYDAEKKLHGMFKIVYVVIGLIAMLLGVALYFGVDIFFASSMTLDEISKAKIMMLILTLNLGLTFSFSLYSSIITAYEKFVFQKIISIIGTVLKPLLMIPLLFFGMKSVALTVIITLVNAGTILSNYFYCKYKLNVNVKYNGFDKKLFKTILGYSIWLFMVSIVDKINWSVDNFILGAVSGTVAVSIYSIAGQINIMFMSISIAVSGVFLPKMSKTVALNNNTEVLTNEFIKVGRIQFYIIFLIMTGFIFFGKQFIQFWLGPGWEESYYITLCLLCPQIVPLIQNLGLSIMQAMSKYKFKAISTFIMAIFNLIISIFLAKKYGAIGAALGTTISIIIVNIVVINIYYYYKIKLNVIKFWGNIFGMVIKYVPFIVVIALMMKYVYVNNIISFIITGVSYVIIYSAISYMFVFDQYEMSIVENLMRKSVNITKKLRKKV